MENPSLIIEVNTDENWIAVTTKKDNVRAIVIPDDIAAFNSEFMSLIASHIPYNPLLLCGDYELELRPVNVGF